MSAASTSSMASINALSSLPSDQDSLSISEPAAAPAPAALTQSGLGSAAMGSSSLASLASPPDQSALAPVSLNPSPENPALAATEGDAASASASQADLAPAAPVVQGPVYYIYTHPDGTQVRARVVTDPMVWRTF